MAKSIMYKGHEVMQGSTLFEILASRGKDPDAEKKAAAHFRQVITNYHLLSGTAIKVESGRTIQPATK